MYFIWLTFAYGHITTVPLNDYSVRMDAVSCIHADFDAVAFRQGNPSFECGQNNKIWIGTRNLRHFVKFPAWNPDKDDTLDEKYLLI